MPQCMQCTQWQVCRCSTDCSRQEALELTPHQWQLEAQRKQPAWRPASCRLVAFAVTSISISICQGVRLAQLDGEGRRAGCDGVILAAEDCLERLHLFQLHLARLAKCSWW